MGRGMEITGCGRFLQTLMFIANFIIWIGSIILLVFGIWAVVDRPYLENVLGETVYISAAYILIAVGVLMFFLSFLGCFGAIKEIKCMLLMYFVIVLILFIILLVGGILGFVFRKDAEDKVKMGMMQSIKEYKNGSDEPLTKAWDETQNAMKCCGIDNLTDWRLLNNGFKGSEQVPLSCCKSENGNKLQCTNNPSNSNTYERGCYDVAKSAVNEHALYIGVTGIVVALLMILGMIFAMVLFKMIE